MTEAEWLACTDPLAMLHFLRSKASERKMRLFACACVARIRPLLTSPLSEVALEVSERFADGLTTAEELQGMAARLMDSINVLMEQWRASQEADEVEQPDDRFKYEALALAFQVTLPAAREAAYYASNNARDVYSSVVNPAAASCDEAYRNCKQAENMNQATVFRDIFGNPFRPVSLDPVIQTWHDATVVRLAQAAYDERQLPEGTLQCGRLAVLADALEEAGCSNPDIVNHLRGAGPHVRGCWVVDAILGKT